MSIRFRRSIKIAPGVKVNLTKTGVGMTVGPRGAHYSVHSSGRVTRSVGLPGTGLYYQSRTSVQKAPSVQKARTGRAQAAHAPALTPVIEPSHMVPKPGFLASAAEKAYHRGVLAHLTGDNETCVASFEQVLASQPATSSAHLFAGVALANLNQASRAVKHLEAVVQSAGLGDSLHLKYLPPAIFTISLGIKITEGLTARVAASELGTALLLAELYQTEGRLEEAIGLMHQIFEVHADPLVRLSLCDLLLADKDYPGVIETAAGVVNDSDVAVETLHIRAAAQIALGQDAGAFDSFREALAKTSGRDPHLLLGVRYDRALAYEQVGQPAKGRADLERIYAADPTYEDVAARLGVLSRH